jgi:glutamate-1-semialdehyde 2,1-aminomutase
MAEWPFRTNKSKELYERACRSLPGGVSCGIRAKEAGYEPYPLFFDRGKGSRFWDVDENEYIDYLMGDGTLIYGHCPPRVIEATNEQMKKGTNLNTPAEIKIKLAEKIKEHIPGADLTIFTVGGTDSVAMPLRIARGYTGKEKIIKFEGHYHGYNDYTYFDSYLPGGSPLGSEWAPVKIPWSWGIPEDILKYSIRCPLA